MDYSLKYIGPGDWLPCVPASDHTAEYTQKRVRQLLDSGLYEMQGGGDAPDEDETESADADEPVADAAEGKD